MPETENTTGESPNESSSEESEQTGVISFTPSTEEQILAARMGKPVPQFVPIQIVDYNPQWPQLYQREAERIRSALGDRVLLLEHVGSTSVPGLAAKPKIDMLLVVANTADEPSSTNAPSENLLATTGNTHKTMPTPKQPWSRRSSSEHKRIANPTLLATSVSV